MGGFRAVKSERKVRFGQTWWQSKALMEYYQIKLFKRQSRLFIKPDRYCALIGWFVSRDYMLLQEEVEEVVEEAPVEGAEEEEEPDQPAPCGGG